MSKDIFISYSRKDQEFVTRLASDLDAQVAFVWFDRSTIQPGQKWHDEIMEGIRECKAFVVVLSPDAMESRYVREEVHQALELGKTIFPVIYRPAQWIDKFESIVRDIQTVDLQSGSYTDNFQKLVDGLIEAGAGRATGERPFLRQPTRPSLNLVFSKIPGWAFAWGLGWLIFWFIFLLLFAILLGILSAEVLLGFVLVSISSSIAGVAGGLIAGLFTMLTLRDNAPSIVWKHMSPAIRIWGINGLLGIIISALITGLIAQIVTGGTIGIEISNVCKARPDFGECLRFAISIYRFQISMAIFGFALNVVAFGIVFLLSVNAAWFFTGMFAGWQAVHHIRRLEPGITKEQSRSVSLGWGCGAIVAATVMISLWIVIIFLFGVLLRAMEP